MDFELSNIAGGRLRTVFCKNKKFTYYTSEFKHKKPSTFKEIYNIAKPFFDKYVKEYENYKIQRKKITNSIFRLSVFYPSERAKFIDYHNEKILYEIEVDNKNENKIIFEYKNLNLIENDKNPISPFCIKIEVNVFDEDNFFQYDGEKDPRIEDICIICHKNKPNVLVTKCFHLVACNECFWFNNLNCCPHCHKPISGIHKVTFAVSKRKN